MLNPHVLERQMAREKAINLGTINGRKAIVKFNGSGQTTMGGLPLIKKSEACMDFLKGFASQITDRREASKIKYTIEEMVDSTVGMISCGYEDRNDITHLKNDPMLKNFAEIAFGDGTLPSQPTLSRFERSLSKQDLYNLAWFFVKHFVSTYDKAPGRIVIDADDSNIDVYGAQQLSLFNEYYQEYCYMPLFLFEAQSGKLILPILRPGRRNKNLNVFGLLRRLFEYLHEVWPNTIIELRGDAHFCNHLFMDWAHDKTYIRFTTGLTPNNPINQRVERLVKKAKALHKAYPELKDTWYHQFTYKMGPWEYAQSVIAKIEIGCLGVTVRYIVTNKTVYEDYSPFLAYCYYRGRGRCELNIRNFKELHGDRLSCHSFMANTFRLFLYAAAYVVLHTLKSKVEPKFKRGQKGRVVRLGMSFHNFIYNIMRSPAIVKVTKTTIQIEPCENTPAFDELYTYYCTLALKTA